MSLPSGVIRILNARNESAFAVLGLPPSEVSPAEIEAAKLTQLARIDAHPERHTPVADDARLAVHVAAAQLLDPVLRRQAMAESGKPSRSAPVAEQPRAVASPRARSTDVPASWAAFAKQAGPVLAHAGGGINSRSLPLLGLLAARHGVEIGDVPLALRVGQAEVIRPVEVDRAVLVSDDDTAEPTSSLRDGLTIAFVIVAFLLSVFMVVQGFKSVYRTVGLAQEPSPPETLLALPETSGPERDGPLVRPEDPLAALRSASSLVESEPVVAAEWFEMVWPEIALGWLDLDAATRQEVIGDTLSVVRGTWSRSTLLERVFERLSSVSGAESGLSSVLASAEVADAIERLPDLPRAADPFLSELVGALPGHAAGDDASPLVALRAMLDTLVAIPAAASFDQWLDAVSVYVAESDLDAERIRAIDRLVTRHDHPAELLDAPLRVLFRGIDVAPGSPLARWLPRAFRDADVSNTELHELMMIVASIDPVDAIDTRLILPVDATSEERTSVRESIESLLDPVSRVRDRRIVRAWAGLARSTLRRMDTESAPTTPGGWLERAILLSRLSEAARWLENAEFSGAILRDLPGPLDQITAVGNPGEALPRLAFQSGGELDFVTRYERVRRTPQQLLSLLVESQELSADIAAPVAEIIAEEALLGTDRDSREAAFVTVFNLAGTPVMLNALLETLPRADRSTHTSSVIQQVTGVALPAPSDPDWSRAVRAAVVSRLLEEFSLRGDSQRIGSLAGLLDASYAARAADADPVRAVMRGGTAEVFASQMLSDAMRRAGELPSPEGFGISIDEIRRRARGREAIARGSVETFAARQASLLSVSAYLLSVEDPSVVRSAREVLANVTRERRSAITLLEQVVAIERGFVELWMLRLGERASDAMEDSL